MIIVCIFLPFWRLAEIIGFGDGQRRYNGKINMEMTFEEENYGRIPKNRKQDE